MRINYRLPLTLAAIATVFASSAERSFRVGQMRGLPAYDSTELTYTPPEGESILYSRDADIFNVSGTMAFQTVDYCSAPQVVFTANNEVYFQNPITGTNSGAYLKGILENDVITVTLPQPVYETTWEDGSHHVFYATKMNLEKYDDGSWKYVVDVDSQTIQYYYDEATGIITQERSEEGTTIMGLTDPEGIWYGFSDWNQVYTPMPPLLIIPPADAQFADNWIFRNGNDGNHISVATSGSEIYIKGFDSRFDSWMAARIEGDKILFPASQYIGIHDFHHIYLMTAQLQDRYYPEYDMTFQITTLCEGLEFNYDADSQKISAPDNSFLLINKGDRTAAYYTKIENACFYAENIEVPVADPEAPAFTTVIPYSEDLGFFVIQFSIPPFDINGRMLDTEKIYYNVLIDGESFTFYPDEYLGLEEEITDVPYSLSLPSGLSAYGSVRSIYFYIDGVETVGIQTMYEDEDLDSTLFSSVAEYCFQSSGISSPTDYSEEVVSVTYHNLQGIATQHPANGIYIVSKTYADGRIAITKQLFK